MNDKTHYRKAFNSPYLSSADIVGPTVLNIKHVRLEPDQTKKSKELFNTAYFVETELRPGEKLKPMILNASNSRTVKNFTGSPFIDDWNNIAVTIYVDSNVRFGRDTVEGLRISPEQPNNRKKELTPESGVAWDRAISAYQNQGSLENVLKHAHISDENQKTIFDIGASNAASQH